MVMEAIGISEILQREHVEDSRENKAKVNNQGKVHTDDVGSRKRIRSR